MIIDKALYKDGVRDSRELSLSEIINEKNEEKTFIWIGLYEPTKEEFIPLAESLNLHDLAVEDALKAHQRPKIEEYGVNHFFLVTKTAYFKDKSNLDLSVGEVMFFIGENYIISVRHGSGLPLNEIRKDLEVNQNFLSYGPWTVVYKILDKIIDEFTSITAIFDQGISELEKKVFTQNDKSHYQDIYHYKREINEFKQALEPLVFPLQKLTSSTSVNVPATLIPYYRDLDDHLTKAKDQAQKLEGLINSVFQVDLANLQIRQNNDVRKISAWVAIAALPTMLAGIYGMNFKYMPELETKYGYYLVTTFMITFSYFIYRKFKKSKWL